MLLDMASNGGTLSLGPSVFLVAALTLALTFEFVNGFHDTANAVATVIYTRTLRPTSAVIWSGCWNLVGVLASTGTVAFGVLALLTVELVLNVGSVVGFAMVFSSLISATLWNLRTWYLGLPVSSSHTLIGSIFGLGLANSILSGRHEFGEGLNWSKTSEVGISLLNLTGRRLCLRSPLANGGEVARPVGGPLTAPEWREELLERLNSVT